MTAMTIPAAALALGLIAAALFPSALRADPVTGTGGGPETTIYAPHRAPTGRTVPPGREGAPSTDPQERTPRQKALDPVLGSVCESC